MESRRRNISSGAPWEASVGYSRAVRVGNLVYVAGTAAVDELGEVVAPDDMFAQAMFVLARIEESLRQAGARREHVVRTRMYVTDISRWSEAGRAHGEYFRDIRPASTMVEVSRLISPGMVIEIEADAVVPA
jgi:enamine deaminase RidA (YjgF/YER057c/UK114 family)